MLDRWREIETREGGRERERGEREKRFVGREEGRGTYRETGRGRERVETVKTCVRSYQSQHRSVPAGGCSSITPGSPLAPMTRYDLPTSQSTHFTLSWDLFLFVCMDDNSIPHIDGFLIPQLI